MWCVMVMMTFIWSASLAQELSIGPMGGALFMQGGRGGAPEMRGRGIGSSFAFGGEVVYSLASVPLDFVGQVSYSPMGGRGMRRDSLAAVSNDRERRDGRGSSLFSMGLGGRWVPMRGPVSPYLGVSFLLSHQDGDGFRPDSAQGAMGTAVDPETARRDGEFGRRGGSTDFGVGVSVGSEFALSSLIRFDVGASYSLYAPLQRGRSTSAIGFGASVLFTLF